MKLWQVIYPNDTDDAGDDVWVATKREAMQLARDGYGQYRPVFVPSKKSELIKFLNTHR